MKHIRGIWYAERLAAVALCILSWVSAVRADVPITIIATIVEPTCSVTDASGNSQTEVDFKSISVDEISSGVSTVTWQPFVMKVTCEGASPVGKTLKMYINPTWGTIAYAGHTVLGTSMPGLGIDLVDKNSVSLPLKTWMPVVTGTGGLMTAGARLVSEKVADLKGGSFASTASVTMAYQ
ncbi:fimbrial protein [Salmonella enterica subsp. enterica serovar Urbana]|nr:fimbrial protein [Salmonella enterica subsp. enterica serovar Chester]EGI5934732.1 fimbrial protein [Salmonella enterica subsp. enterica serovar Urbana]MLT46678.1 fimbrial protein [Salmonella enterica subsp. enterica serovar Chester]